MPRPPGDSHSVDLRAVQRYTRHPSHRERGELQTDSVAQADAREARKGCLA